MGTVSVLGTRHGRVIITEENIRLFSGRHHRRLFAYIQSDGPSFGFIAEISPPNLKNLKKLENFVKRKFGEQHA